MSARDRPAACPCCDSEGLETFYELEGVPSHSCLLMETREEALAFPKADLRLALCRTCGFVFNVAFDPELQAYSERYEDPQGFSPRFREFAHALASRLVSEHTLEGQTVLEIGCGKGEFLALLCELGGSHGIGIDPAVVEDRIQEAAGGRVTFIQDYYSEEYADVTGNLVICRHTLEHIHDPAHLLGLALGSLDGPSAVLCVEVPDLMRVLRHTGFWDLYYEHCSYFTPGSLARLLRRVGFAVTDVSLEFDDQYVVAEAVRADSVETAILEAEEDPSVVAQEVAGFQARVDGELSRWRSEIAQLEHAGKRAVVWGSSSKGVAFLTTLGLDRGIEYVVDVNPYRHGRFMVGTGQEIVPPSFLAGYQPDVVIAMNSIYRDEIQRDLDRLGVGGRLVAL
jgi:SAM-dependent methyltransferase